MPFFVTVRRSPAYLYLKAYCLCALVTLFKATPVSSRLPRIGERLQLHRYRIVNTRLGPRIVPVEHDPPGRRGGGGGAKLPPGNTQPKAEHLVISRELVGAWARQSHPRVVLQRWWQRAVDLAQVKARLLEDEKDTRTYPEVEWDAVVRRSPDIHPEERRFIELRRLKISSSGANSLHSFLQLPDGLEVDPRDVPLIALGGSGGGYRAMYGYAAVMSASKELGLWDCLTWTAGVSGSCWTLAAYYTLASHDISRLTKHYLEVADERAHPISVQALDTVARSSKGVYFLIGPLVRKAQNGIIGLGIMDLYATLTTTYQFLSRKPRARLSRATFQFSKVWSRSGIDKGEEPMPILTAVRRAPKDGSGVKPHKDSSNTKGVPPGRALAQHQTGVSGLIPQSSRAKEQRETREVLDSSLANGFFQWFEISPLEVGSPDVNAYVPTWSWGRTFASGRSFGRPPEQSLALLLGQCTNAPAGPLTGYIATLLASLPQGTFMSRVLLLVNEFLRMKRWERLWFNPIRAGHDPNPFYGLNYHPRDCTDDSQPRWESQGRVRLMDSGMSNNLPNHVLARPERAADVIIAFDASSDVRSGSAIRRIQNWADDCGIKAEEVTDCFASPKSQFQTDEVISGEETSAAAIEAQFLGKYARVFRGRREDGREIYLIYCPLLPNGVNPDFDPSTASFSSSYNLVWTPGQIKTLFSTAEANISMYAANTIRRVVRKVYLANKERREELESSSQESRNRLQRAAVDHN
ncbi:FabD/lysophospholipase-like protein [Thozetella sp. PMI_491]|nr:FabD/lysophospholipase-like protein [Thozetella sp. PMI_491]